MLCNILCKKSINKSFFGRFNNKLNAYVKWSLYYLSDLQFRVDVECGSAFGLLDTLVMKHIPLLIVGQNIIPKSKKLIADKPYNYIKVLLINLILTLK